VLSLDHVTHCCAASKVLLLVMLCSDYMLSDVFTFQLCRDQRSAELMGLFGELLSVNFH